jgi:hypothetical protein
MNGTPLSGSASDAVAAIAINAAHLVNSHC